MSIGKSNTHFDINQFFFNLIRIDVMDTSNSRQVQEKSISVNKISTSSSPDDESKVNNKKLRPTGNTDIREWDIPKFQQEKEKSPTERQIIEEPPGNQIKQSFAFYLLNF